MDVVIPEGYRLLESGEWFRKGDLYCRSVVDGWRPVVPARGRWNPLSYWPVARKVVDENTEELRAKGDRGEL